jgi:hypothetical protein
MDSYRRGRFAAALELAEQGFAKASQVKSRILAKAVSSLALASLGNREQAIEALNFAKTQIDKLIKRNADGSIRANSLFDQSGQLDHDLLIPEILIREAAAALGM